MRRTRTITKTVTKTVEYRLDITLEQLYKKFSIPDDAALKMVGPDGARTFCDGDIITATWTVTK